MSTLIDLFRRFVGPAALTAGESTAVDEAADEDGPIEAEFVDDEPGAHEWPAATQPGSGARA